MQSVFQHAVALLKSDLSYFASKGRLQLYHTGISESRSPYILQVTNMWHQRISMVVEPSP